jgi:hypothetical protein
VTPPGAVRHVVTAIVERPSTRRIDVLVVGEEEPRAMRLSSGQLTRVLDVIEDHRFHSSFSLTELIDPFGATETR